MGTIRRLRQEWTYAARDLLGRHRALFAVLAVERRFRTRMVGEGTDVCIEGFPRSANSLAVRMFSSANPGLLVAHHVHVPMQVVRAVELGIPCAVLIRDPVDAICSLLIRSQDRLSQRRALASYVAFYRPLIAIRGEIARCRFDEVIDDPSIVASRINALYGTRFHETGGATPAEIVARIRRANRAAGLPEASFSAPSAVKERLRQRLVERLGADPRLARASAVHESFLGP